MLPGDILVTINSLSLPPLLPLKMLEFHEEMTQTTTHLPSSPGFANPPSVVIFYKL